MNMTEVIVSVWLHLFIYLSDISFLPIILQTGTFLNNL